MVRTSSVGSALLVAASALTLSNAHLEYTIRVRNLTYMQPFSPIFFIAHTKDISIFKEGLEANSAMKVLSEDGDASALEALANDQSTYPHVCGYVTGSDVHMPGTTERYTIEVDDDLCDDGVVISMASMLVNTNDAFVGFDSETLKTGGTSKLFPIAWDSGTEVNNEYCSHIPGPACAGIPGNLDDGPGEGYVHVHRGIHYVGDLDEATSAWINPVAEVFIAKPVQL